VTHLFIAESKWELYGLVCSEHDAIDCEIFVVSDTCFQKISTEKAPQGILAVIKYLDFFERCIKISSVDALREDKILILSSVRDPGNLGAILRSAAAFGTRTVLLSDDSADVYNTKTLRAAMGNLFRMRIIVAADLIGCVKELQAADRRVWAAELREGARDLTSCERSARDVFVIGN
jgi:TrmH family RNA methyltransferase